MCKSLEQVKRDVGRYVKLKDLKLPNYHIYANYTGNYF